MHTRQTYAHMHTRGAAARARGQVLRWRVSGTPGSALRCNHSNTYRVLTGELEALYLHELV